MPSRFIREICSRPVAPDGEVKVADSLERGQPRGPVSAPIAAHRLRIGLLRGKPQASPPAGGAISVAARTVSEPAAIAPNASRPRHAWRTIERRPFEAASLGGVSMDCS